MTAPAAMSFFPEIRFKGRSWIMISPRFNPVPVDLSVVLVSRPVQRARPFFDLTWTGTLQGRTGERSTVLVPWPPAPVDPWLKERVR